MTDYYIKPVTRKGKRLWVIASHTGPDFVPFKEKVSAEKALRELLSGTATMCDCGEWVHYQGGRKTHKCMAVYKGEHE